MTLLPFVGGLSLALVITGCGGTDAVGGSPTPVGAGGTAGSGGNNAAAAGGTATATGTGGAAGGPAECAVAFTFTTVDNHGRYSPRNVSAVWVTDAESAFVKTLEENGYIRQEHLTAWEQTAKGNTVDAVTGATNFSARTHHAMWDCSDVRRAPVAPGAYTLNAEFATDNGSGFVGNGSPLLLQVPLQVGDGPQTITPPDAQYFTAISVTYR